MQAATEIKDRIRDELGFTVNVGVSSNKLLAKMASDFRKPDLVHTLFPWEIREKMWRLPVRDLFFVGTATERKLKNLGDPYDRRTGEGRPGHAPVPPEEAGRSDLEFRQRD